MYKHVRTDIYTHTYTHLHLHIHINIYSQQKANERDRLPLLMLEPQAWSFLLLWFLICTWTKAFVSRLEMFEVAWCTKAQDLGTHATGPAGSRTKIEIHLAFPNAYDCIHTKAHRMSQKRTNCFTASNLTDNLFEFMVLCPGAEAAGHRARILWVASCVKA